ncbi:MAG: hypothetical protein H2058_13325 [Muricauda sp.]|nr:hypothetical protein [Allomuricauda sp.]MBA4746231.1 hypothetical protein [Allomuricauda sp.]
MMNQINNVIVDNGILEHIIQWNYSPSQIRNFANRALAFVPADVVHEINSKKMTVLIKTESDYGNVISKTIIGANNELLFKFNNIN